MGQNVPRPTGDPGQLATLLLVNVRGRSGRRLCRATLLLLVKSFGELGSENSGQNNYEPLELEGELL
jgi:hypothetical protein